MNATNGSNLTSNVLVSSVNGFAGNISLSAGTPPGWVSSYAPSQVAVIAGGNSATILTVTVPANTSASSYVVLAVGTSSATLHSATLSVIVQTVPSAPSNLVVAGTLSQIILNWSKPTSNGGLPINGYNVYRGTSSDSETKIALLGANSLSYIDSQVEKSQLYFYEVTATNSIGESIRSNQASNKTSAATFVISNFTVVAGGSGYTTPVVQITGGGGAGAMAVARVSNGVIFGVTLIKGGSGFTSTPTVTFNDPSPRAGGALTSANMVPG